MPADRRNCNRNALLHKHPVPRLAPVKTPAKQRANATAKLSRTAVVDVRYIVEIVDRHGAPSRRFFSTSKEPFPDAFVLLSYERK